MAGRGRTIPNETQSRHSVQQVVGHPSALPIHGQRGRWSASAPGWQTIHKRKEETTDGSWTEIAIEIAMEHGRNVKTETLEVIQTAVNKLAVPESCEGKMRGEYVKCGMRLAINAINAAIADHNRAAESANASDQRPPT
jgi:hypothetical protein